MLRYQLGTRYGIKVKVEYTGSFIFIAVFCKKLKLINLRKVFHRLNFYYIWKIYSINQRLELRLGIKFVLELTTVG